jgi:hypothetical protein
MKRSSQRRATGAGVLTASAADEGPALVPGGNRSRIVPDRLDSEEFDPAPSAGVGVAGEPTDGSSTRPAAHRPGRWSVESDPAPDAPGMIVLTGNDGVRIGNTVGRGDFGTRSDRRKRFAQCPQSFTPLHHMRVS